MPSLIGVEDVNMKLNWRFVGMLLAILLGATPGSWAHDDPPPKVTITPVPTATTLSRTGATNYASYTVTVSNRSDDRLGHLVFSATSTVPDGGGALAAFVSSDGLATPCSASPSDSTTANCTLPPLAKYVGTVTFALIYKAPTAGTVIKLNATLKFAEDAHDRRKTVLAAASTNLSAPVANSVVSYVPAATGGTFGTGLNIDPTTGIASATSEDPTVTTVVVPPGKATTAQIQESPLLQSCAIFNTCYISDITIPGTGFDHLTIFLTRDASTIPRPPPGSICDDDDSRAGCSSNRGVNINNVVILYDHLDGQGSLPVPNCADDPTRPSAGRPCVKNRTAFPRKAPTPLIDQGDWRFEIWATDNGRYSW